MVGNKLEREKKEEFSLRYDAMIHFDVGKERVSWIFNACTVLCKCPELLLISLRFAGKMNNRSIIY